MTITRYDEAFALEVKKASDDDIVFLCSTEDAGASGGTVYPAHWSEWTDAISGVDSFGKEVNTTDRNARFYFTGENISTPGLSYGLLPVPESGSSIATAVAAGTASVVLSCRQWANPDKIQSRRKLVGRVFDAMRHPNDKYVHPSRFFGILNEREQRRTEEGWHDFLRAQFGSKGTYA